MRMRLFDLFNSVLNLLIVDEQGQYRIRTPLALETHLENANSDSMDDVMILQDMGFEVAVICKLNGLQ